MEKYVIIKDTMRKIRRFNLQGRIIEFKLKPVPAEVEPVGWVKDAVHQLVQNATADLEPQDQVGFSFCSKDFKRGDGWIRFREAAQVAMEDVWNTIASIYQSNSMGLNTDTFCLGVTSVRMPAGRGSNRRIVYNTFNEECAMRRGIITINNKDNMCLPRALAVAVAYVDKEPNYTKIRKDTGKLQTQIAFQLTKEAGVTIPEDGAGISELRQFQEHLKNYTITVYRHGSKGRDIFYEGPAVEGQRRLNLIYHDGHYNVITSLTAAFACVYYCEQCHVSYNTKYKHKCGGTCPACQQTPACIYEMKVTCDDCLRIFRSQTCYNNHKNSESKNSVCSQIRLCPECLKNIKSDRPHVCGEVFCKICRKYQLADHLCYMQPDLGKPNADEMLFVFYDLETQQQERIDDTTVRHNPNLCVFRQCCSNCMNTDNQSCVKCGLRLQILKNNPIERFIEFLLNQRKLFKSMTVLAHNGQAFDHQFILNYLLTKTSLKPELIMRGTKIILMQVANIRFLDSLNYFPMALSALPKAFGLEKKFKKGYFPHLFNTSDNENYVGPLPPIHFYGSESMKPEERDVFMKWYQTHKDDVFDMQRDIVSYCVSDVEILTQACLKFREQMMKTSNVCPFAEACTIASACNKVFRRNFLQPDTIGIIPRNGYRWGENQSRIAVQWLVWQEKQLGINIIHAGKNREAIVAGVKVDGYCTETNQVFEFHGCLYHGHPNCLKYRRDEPLYGNPTETLNSRYEATMAKSNRLRKQGYEVSEKWECDFRRELKVSQEIAKYTLNHPLLNTTPLDPRDAFYGGRTGNTKTYYKAKDGEVIKYLDVCSLYPYVCKFGKFVIGHPQVYVGEECLELDLENTEGLIKCKILPPQELYHPVLPTKMNNKLMFVLCRSCGEHMNYEECSHSEEQRSLSGTWVIDEVLQAIKNGYIVMEIYEIWRYKVEQYDTIKKRGGLFVQMMNKFIKIKQEASGWPEHCKSIEEKEKYIKHFMDREDVQLEFNEMAKNPGLRCLAKLMLNSFWGKFGQRENQPKTSIVNAAEEFFEMVSNPSIDVNHILPVNDETLIINWEYKEESYNALTTVNVCLAAYTTTQARLKLYGYLEQLGDRVLYYDTDSVIFVHKEGEYEPPVGELIGDLTDELETYGFGSYITEFVSGGPKNYAYKLFSTADQEEKIVCKVKGICLNYNASQKVNFDSMKDMILKGDSEPIKIVSHQIRRTCEHEVVTGEEIKQYRPNSTKRKFLPSHNSLPYGFKKQKQGNTSVNTLYTL